MPRRRGRRICRARAAALGLLIALGAAGSPAALTPAAGANADRRPARVDATVEAGVAPMFARWETLGTAAGLPSEKVLAVAVDGDTVWAGTEKGLARLEAGRVVRVLGTADGLPFPAVTALAVDPATGDVWAGTLGGLARVSGERVHAFTQLDSGLANDVVYGVALGGGEVWVATAAGLSRLHLASGTWRIYDTTNTLMHEPWCYAVTAGGGDVYVAVWGGGVLVHEAQTGHFREHRDPDGEMEIDLFPDDGLVHDVTSAIAWSDDVLWVGTYFGLSRYERRSWQSYTRDDSGLIGDFINFLRAADGAVWIGTDQGLGRFDSSHWHAWSRSPETGRAWLTVTAPDGSRDEHPLESGPASNTVFSIDLQGDGIWLGTAAGLSHGIGSTSIKSAAEQHAPNPKGAHR